jgi:hypothetical protein
MGIRSLATRSPSGEAFESMLTESNTARAASPRSLRATGIVVWTLLSWACSGTAPVSGGYGHFLQSDEAGPDPMMGGEAGGDATGDATANNPSFMGKAIPDPEIDASGSVASPDGYCPIPDSLLAYGATCPTCAQTHCSSALAECDPTMVNACSEYYCPTQCLRPDAQGGEAVCQKVVGCCASLIATSLYWTCLGYTASSAQASCQSFLAQAQAIGRCP